MNQEEPEQISENTKLIGIKKLTFTEREWTMRNDEWNRGNDTGWTWMKSRINQKLWEVNFFAFRNEYQ